jgi:diaminopimelate decarboxylase
LNQEFLVSEAGYFLAKLIIVKTNILPFAGIDSGQCNPSNVLRLTTPYRKPQTQREERFTLDIFAKQTHLQNRRIAKSKKAIYSLLEMQNLLFLWRQTITPDTNQLKFLWMNGEGHLIRAHETFDLLKNQIPLPQTIERTVLK